MQENPPTHLDHETPAYNQPATLPPHPRKRLVLPLIITGVVSLAMVTAIALVYISRHKSSSASTGSSKQSLTFYYRDGKTVLWDSSKDQGSDTEISGFIAKVKEDLGDTYSPIALNKGDWHVTTTLDAKLQQKAKEQVVTNQTVFDKQGVKNGALIAEDVTNGQIVSWIGGLKDFDVSSDTVSQKTIVGSLALPLTYASLIENTTNYGAGSVFIDEQVPLDGYPCTNKARPTEGGNCLYNYDYRYVGQLTLRQALGAVRLVPAAKAGQTVGTLKLVSYFNKLLPDSHNNHFACYMAGSVDFSYQDETQCYLAAAHGDGLLARPQDMIQAYATLANNGKSVQQVSFLSVTVDDKSKQTPKPKTAQAIRQDTAYIISDILSDPINNYLPASYDHIFTSNGSKVSVQTGVTSDGTVGGMVQYTDRYAIGFWGLATGPGQSIKGASETVTEPVVTGWLSAAAQASVTQSNRSKPAAIKELPSPTITLSLPTSPIGPSPAIDLYPSWYK